MTALIEIHQTKDYSQYLDVWLTLGIVSFLVTLYVISLKYKFITNEDIFEQNEKLYKKLIDIETKLSKL